jgi:hypothetical protein
MTFEFFTTNSTVLDEGKSSLLLFDILCRQLLSLERYRRKKGVEVKVHCIAELRALYGMCKTVQLKYVEMCKQLATTVHRCRNVVK